MRRILTALRRQLAGLRPRRLTLAPVPVRRPVARRGLTLVEMLVTLAITLIMMAAVVNVFASIGQSVEHRRASIEVSNQVRIARTLLAQDLSRTTATTLPPRDPSSGEGYIELIEGIHTDWFPTRLTDGVNQGANAELDKATSLIPRARAAGADEDDLSTQQKTKFFSMPDNELSLELEKLGLSALGDYDDILAFTVRSDGEPFVGRFGDTTIESQEAEIIWYAIEHPPVDRGSPFYLGEPGMRTVFRRVLLIAPWVDADNDADPSTPTPLQLMAQKMGVPQFTDQPAILREFYRHFDLSVHVAQDSGRWVANSLADLTKRENRFAHLPEFSHGLDLRQIRSLQAEFPSPPPKTPLVPLGLYGTGGSSDANTRRGEDTVLTNVLAFDLRVFDPTAPILAVNGIAVEPSDLGWRVKQSNSPWTANPNATVVGYGAYVDLAYHGDPSSSTPNYEHNPLNPPGFASASLPPIGTGSNTSQFSMRPSAKSGFVSSGIDLGIRSFYDTWSFHYEYDGINQRIPDLPNNDFIDEGTNGVDDDGVNGVDDIGERETLPPYLTPLRGIEVKLRVYEPDSRIIREVSVKQNFTPQ